MSWEVVEMRSFLFERKGKFKPNDKAINGLKRIEKIDFSGMIYLSDKASKTDMILIKPGDLVISGINVEKGAMSIYKGEENVVATIHYSSYEYNLEKIDLDFLRHFLKSSEFLEALKEQVPGGIKTEIKPKHILPLKVCIPTNVEEQREVVEFLDKQNYTIEAQSTELTHQLDLVKQLRQAFLREAMQGKLVPQYPNDEPASVLLEKIKVEKDKWIKEKVIKKPKPIPPILDFEVPYDIPTNWTWCRLGEFAFVTSGSTPKSSAFVSEGIPFLKMYNLREQKIDFDYKQQFIKEEVHNGALKRCRAFPGDLIMNIVGPPLGKLAIIPDNLPECNFNQAAVLIRPTILEMNKYLFWYLSEMSEINEVETKGVAGQNNISVTQAHSMKIPLPPISEQQRIVTKLDELMQYCDDLEASIKASQQQNELLLQQVLREALEPKSIEEKQEDLAIAAEPQAEYEKGKVIALKPTHVDYYRRSVLAAEIVWQLHKEPTLGHLKLQKLIYLCQKTVDMQLSTNFLRQAMGPYDNRLMRSIDKQLKEKKWFEYQKDQVFKYQPLEKAGQHHKDFLKYFSEEREDIQFIIDKFKTIKSDIVEIVATLYACIDNMLNENVIFSETLLIQRFYEWSEEKKKFSEKEVKRVFSRMKETGIIPRGCNI